jgi:uncharacterized membrane protein YbhN (UPF0104 family)
MPTLLKSVWRPIATVAVLIVTVTSFIYYFATHPLVRQQLHQTSWVTLVTLFILYLGVVVALSLVTFTTLRLCNIKLTPGESGLLTMYATVINFFGPLQSGPAFRGVYLKRKHGLNLKQYTLATLVFYAMYAMFSLIFLLSGIMGWWLVIIAIVGIAVLAFVRISTWSVAQRFQVLNLDAIYALAAATLFQLSLVAVIYFVELRSIQHGVTFGQAVIYAGAANFSLFVSLTPGAIGFRESFLLFSQRLHHIDSSTIVAANIIDRSMYIVLLAVIGLVIFSTHAQRRLQAK